MKLAIYFFFFVQGLHLTGQSYYSKLIPFPIDSINPNPIDLGLFNNNIYIPLIYPGLLSTLLISDKEVTNLEYLHISNFVFSKKPLAFINNNIYIYAKDREISNDQRLIKLSSNHEQIFLKSYNTLGEYNFPTGTFCLNNHIYITAVDDYNDGSHREVNVKKIDTLGNELWSKNYGQTDNRTYCWEAEASMDDHILLSTGFHNGGIFSQLIKIDTLGGVVWRWRDTEECRNGGVNHNIAPLGDGNTVLTTSLDKFMDEEFWIKDWYPFPPKLSWISPEGKLIKDTLLTSPHYNELLIYDLQAGRGDYFFGFGQWVDPDTDEQYGWLFKMSSTGEMLWNRHYQHGEFYAQDYDHIFKDLVELDNGDLLIMGDINPPGGKNEIWLVKLDENGCLGDDDCGDEIVLAEENLPEINHNIMLYPNPTSYSITISGIPEGKYTYCIINTQGQQVLSSALQNEDIIDVSDLPSGMYFIELINEDGQRWIEKFVVGR
ncbi:MAG: T9SS type A sorting domain-containing protein [Saprospiraceae bacterium]|nr:T9SS type A sorting domain-containing protein [Saprospiraceae bacterium]